jgi:hypothetical protein
MNAIKGFYNNGKVELLEKPQNVENSEVLVIFPDTNKGIVKINGLFKNQNIDYDQIENDLKESNLNSENHLLGKAE